MTVKEFQTNHSGDLKTIIENPVMREALNLVGALRPNPEYSEHSHIFVENRGAIRGYELCIRNLIGLSFPPAQTPDIKPTYGVPDVKPSEKKD